MTTFLDALPPDVEVLIVSTGRRIQVRQMPTTDRKKAKDSVTGLMADGGPTPLMDALRDIDERFLRGPGDRWPVFVIVTGDGSENSKNTDAPSFNAWLRTLPPRRIVAHAIVLKTTDGFAETIARMVVQATGGHLETVGNGGLLAARLKALAEKIPGDYPRPDR